MPLVYLTTSSIHAFCKGHQFQKKTCMHDKLRAGAVDGQPTSDTQSMNAQSALSASTAKMKSLPSLQANQDPFGPLIAYYMIHLCFRDVVQVSFFR